MVLLRKDSQRSAQTVEFTDDGDAQCRFLVTDLAPGRWQATRDNGGEPQTFEVTADAGAG